LWDRHFLYPQSIALHEYNLCFNIQRNWFNRNRRADGRTDLL